MRKHITHNNHFCSQIYLQLFLLTVNAAIQSPQERKPRSAGVHGWPPRKLFSGLRPPSSQQLHYSRLSSRIKLLTALQSNTAWYQHFHSKNQSQSLNRGGSGSSRQYGCHVATANIGDETIVWPGVVRARVAKKRTSVQCFISHNALQQQS